MQNPRVDNNGDKLWRNKDGKLHREDGPAIERANGDRSWWVNGKKHRLDGPAVESGGAKFWYVNGERHRLDGPAIEYANDDKDKEWYANGKKFSGPLDLLEYGAKLEDIAQYLTPREIAKCRIQ